MTSADATIKDLCRHHSWGSQHTLQLNISAAGIAKHLRKCCSNEEFGCLFKFLSIKCFELWGNLEVFWLWNYACDIRMLKMFTLWFKNCPMEVCNTSTIRYADQVNITKFMMPEVLQGASYKVDIMALKVCVTWLDQVTQSAQNPQICSILGSRKLHDKQIF